MILVLIGAVIGFLIGFITIAVCVVASEDARRDNKNV